MSPEHAEAVSDVNKWLVWVRASFCRRGTALCGVFLFITGLSANRKKRRAAKATSRARTVAAAYRVCVEKRVRK